MTGVCVHHPQNWTRGNQVSDIIIVYLHVFVFRFDNSSGRTVHWQYLDVMNKQFNSNPSSYYRSQCHLVLIVITLLSTRHYLVFISPLSSSSSSSCWWFPTCSWHVVIDVPAVHALMSRRCWCFCRPPRAHVTSLLMFLPSPTRSWHVVVDVLVRCHPTCSWHSTLMLFSSYTCSWHADDAVAAVPLVHDTSSLILFLSCHMLVVRRSSCITVWMWLNELVVVVIVEKTVHFFFKLCNWFRMNAECCCEAPKPSHLIKYLLLVGGSSQSRILSNLSSFSHLHFSAWIFSTRYFPLVCWCRICGHNTGEVICPYTLALSHRLWWYWQRSDA